ncbi:MAG: type II secretion system F family protein [Thauera sp.]|jgi:general secretion pathway protein F|nr:type II secretion system F family protein [Thauera sp.]
MAEFSYRAANAAGAMLEGRIEAHSRELALRQLRAQGLTPVELSAGTGKAAAASAGAGKGPLVAGAAPRAAASSWWRPGGERGPNQADIHHLTHELAVMLRAGLPLDRALRVMAGMAQKPAVHAIVEDLLKSVKAGKGFSQALQTYQSLFGEFYINMVRSGEAGGQLGEVLARLAEHLERMRALRESVVSALIYPAILVVVAALSVVLMLGFVVPQFETLFQDMGEALPLPTRIIVALGHFVGDWGWALLLLVVVVVAMVRHWLRSAAGQQWRDRTLLGLPVLGAVVHKFEITRFARSMGTLLGNGVPVVLAVKIAAATMVNAGLRAAIEGVEPAIKQGQRMAEALEASGLFTPLALNMVKLGEETGRLDAMLLELAQIYDAEVQAGVKRALTLIEPLLILGMGGVIAGIIVSILMGILSVNEFAF